MGGAQELLCFLLVGSGISIALLVARWGSGNFIGPVGVHPIWRVS